MHQQTLVAPISVTVNFSTWMVWMDGLENFSNYEMNTKQELEKRNKNAEILH